MFCDFLLCFVCVHAALFVARLLRFCCTSIAFLICRYVAVMFFFFDFAFILLSCYSFAVILLLC